RAAGGRVGGPEVLVPAAGDAGQTGSTGYTARHPPAAVPAISLLKVSTGPPRRPVSARILVFAGLAIAVIGGWLLLGTGRGRRPCGGWAGWPGGPPRGSGAPQGRGAGAGRVR